MNNTGNQQQAASSRKRKVISAALAVAMAMTMLLSGTLAYFMQTSATNTFRNTSRKVVGHDDFVNLGLDATTKELKYNKDIYVENLGGEPVFVRVKLTEDFTLNGKKIVDEEAPVAHIPVDSKSLGVGTETGDTAGGDENNPAIHDYFTWDMGNGASADKSRKNFLSANAALYTSGTNEKILNEGGVAKDNSGLLYDDLTALDEDTKVNVQTGLAPAPVITMTEYMAKNDFDKYKFTGWVIDDTKDEPVLDAEGVETGETVDGGGWAYWSQMLAGGKTTGLLLNGVTVSSELANEAYTYNIHVDFEVVDRLDKEIWVGTSLKDSSGKVYEEGDLERVKTSGAKRLLTIIEECMPSEEGTALINDITAKRDKAKTATAKRVYGNALSQIGGYSEYGDKNNDYVIEKATLLMQIGDQIERKRAAEGGEEALAKVVIQLDGSGDTRTLNTTADAANSKKILEMDDAVARYLVDTYGDKANTLTYEQALGVTNVQMFGTKGGKYASVESLAGLNLTNFENMYGLYLQYFDSLKTIDLSAFVNPDGELVKGLWDCQIHQCPKLFEEYYTTNSKKFDLDFTALAPTLRDFLLHETSAYINVKGLNQLHDMNSLALLNPTCIGTEQQTDTYFMSMEELNGILERSPDCCYLFLEDISFGKKTEGGSIEVSNDISELNLQSCSKTLWTMFINKQTGTLLVADPAGTWALTRLKQMGLMGISADEKLSCDLSKCVNLISINGGKKADEDSKYFIEVTRPEGLE